MFVAKRNYSRDFMLHHATYRVSFDIHKNILVGTPPPPSIEGVADLDIPVKTYIVADV